MESINVKDIPKARFKYDPTKVKHYINEGNILNSVKKEYKFLVFSKTKSINVNMIRAENKKEITEGRRFYIDGKMFYISSDFMKLLKSAEDKYVMPKLLRRDGNRTERIKVAKLMDDDLSLVSCLERVKITEGELTGIHLATQIHTPEAFSIMLDWYYGRCPVDLDDLIGINEPMVLTSDVKPKVLDVENMPDLLLYENREQIKPRNKEVTTKTENTKVKPVSMYNNVASKPKTVDYNKTSCELSFIDISNQLKELTDNDKELTDKVEKLTLTLNDLISYLKEESNFKNLDKKTDDILEKEDRITNILLKLAVNLKEPVVIEKPKETAEGTIIITNNNKPELKPNEYRDQEFMVLTAKYIESIINEPHKLNPSIHMKYVKGGKLNKSNAVRAYIETLEKGFDKDLRARAITFCEANKDNKNPKMIRCMEDFYKKDDEGKEYVSFSIIRGWYNTYK